MAEATEKQIVDFIKKNPDLSIAEYARKLKLPAGSAGPIIWRLEPVAISSLKIPGTGASIAKARDTDGLRWERIAARTGKSIAEVKRLYTEKTGRQPEQSYTGRGRDFSKGGATKSSGGTRTTRGQSGRRQSSAKANTGTSGRRQASGKKSGRAAGRRTRGDKAGSPS